MKIIACGSRSWTDREMVYMVLDRVSVIRKLDWDIWEHRVRMLIHGGAKGADEMAGQWALIAGIPQTVFRAQWDVFGRRAGMIRNQLMLTEGKPDLVLAFRMPGKSPGTDDMIRRAREAGVRVEVYGPDGRVE